jgi:uncharacterized protein
MMKRFALLLILFSLVFNAMADGTWTVRSVPNTRLNGNDIHVSDPDGYLSDSVEMTINTALSAIRDKADVFVVTLTSIGDADPRHFATELFNYWGIGDAETNNGVLLLFVEDQHALETETGYGAEETLTDAKCERIFTNTIKPFFKAGDYEGGLCAGVADIVTVYGGTVPDGLKTTLPGGGDGEGDTGSDLDFKEIVIFGAIGLLLLVLPFCGLVFWAAKSKTKAAVSDEHKAFEEAGATYVDGLKSSWTGSPWDGRGCLGAMTIGLSVFLIIFIAIFIVSSFSTGMSTNRQAFWVFWVTLFLYLTWVCFRHNHRVLKIAKKLSKNTISPRSVYKAALDHGANKAAMWMAPWLGWIYYVILKKKLQSAEACICPKCNSTMEAYPAYRLPEAHVVENRLGALDYQPYRCLHGHVVVVKEHGSQFENFTTCEKCGAYTMKQTETKTLKQATYDHAGEKMESYECQHCGETLMKMVVIPQLIHYSSSSSSSSSGSSSHSSYHSSHSSHRSGSFGGGRSGGGGHSGRW